MLFRSEQIEERIDEMEEHLEEMKACGTNKPKKWADSPESTRPFFMSQDSSEDTLEKKAVSGATDLPLGDGEWDGPAAKKRIFEWAGGDDFDPNKAKRAFFYVDGDPKNKGSYKLPFADVRDGKLVAIKKGISSAQGALDGARGGIQGVSDADKAAIMAKINAYKKRMADDEKAYFALLDFKKYLKEVK